MSDENNSPPKKRTIKSLRTGAWDRGFQLAKTYAGTGSRLIGQKVLTTFMSSDDGEKAMFQSFLKELTKFTAQIGELKGSFQKVGQMLAMFGDQFLPPEALKILSALQSDSPALDWEPIEKTLREELSADRLSELEIQHEAIGAASLGQVHRAKTTNGEELALKIQYPGVANATESDLKILRRILGLMNWFPRGPQMDEIFVEVQTMLIQELDYRQELAFLQRLQKYVANDSRYRVPDVFPQYSSGRVLAMSFEDGLSADSAEVLSWSQEDRNQIGILWLELYLKELFQFGFVQTDPHFGNYKVRRAADGSIQLVLLDFGATRVLAQEFWDGYREMLVGTYENNSARVLVGARRMNFIREDDSPALQQIFYDLCCLVSEPFLIDQVYKFSESDLPKRSARLAAEMVLKFKLRTPPRELVFLDRKMAGTYLFLSRLKCEFNPRPFIKKEVEIYRTALSQKQES